MFTPYFSRQLGSKVKSMHYITRWYIEWGQGQARSNVRNLFARWRERILVGCFTCFFGDEKISRMRVFANSPHLSSSLALSALESEVLTLPQRNTWLDSVRGNICHSHLEKEKKNQFEKWIDLSLRKKNYFSTTRYFESSYRSCILQSRVACTVEISFNSQIYTHRYIRLQALTRV